MAIMAFNAKLSSARCLNQKSVNILANRLFYLNDIEMLSQETVKYFGIDNLLVILANYGVVFSAFLDDKFVVLLMNIIFYLGEIQKSKINRMNEIFLNKRVDHGRLGASYSF